MSGRPVSRASRSTASTIDASTRLSTSRGRSRRLRTVWEWALIPSIAVWPTHHADDMGAMLVDPSRFSELTSTTGVPKYSIFGLSSCFTGASSSVRLSLYSRRGASRRCECDGGHPGVRIVQDPQAPALQDVVMPIDLPAAVDFITTHARVLDRHRLRLL